MWAIVQWICIVFGLNSSRNLRYNSPFSCLIMFLLSMILPFCLCDTRLFEVLDILPDIGCARWPVHRPWLTDVQGQYFRWHRRNAIIARLATDILILPLQCSHVKVILQMVL